MSATPHRSRSRSVWIENRDQRSVPFSQRAYPATVASVDCPCGSGASYASCCGRIHDQGGAGLGTQAVALMRARYSAHVRHDEAFLLQSWHPDTRPDAVSFGPDLHWLGLDIVEIVGGTSIDNDGIVEFKARFTVKGDEPGELHERSRFVRLAGQWQYLDGS